MSSMIDFVIATGIFFVSVALVISFVLSYYSNFLGVLQESELRSSAMTAYSVFFSGKGVPENWETSNRAPLKIGLVNDLFRIPVILSTTNETNLNNATLNFTINFDSSCLNKTRESTIKIYNETNSNYPFTIYNRSFCQPNDFLKSADFAVNVTLPALRAKTFYVYFSPEPNINSTSSTYTIAFPQNASNYTAIVYPADKMKMISPSKVRALRNLSYSEIVDTLGGSTTFELEVDAQ